MCLYAGPKVKSRSCEVTGGELTLAVDQLRIYYNNEDTFLVGGKLKFPTQYES